MCMSACCTPLTQNETSVEEITEQRQQKDQILQPQPSQNLMTLVAFPEQSEVCSHSLRG